MFTPRYEINKNEHQFGKLRYYNRESWPYIIIKWTNAGMSTNPDLRAKLVGVYQSLNEAERRLNELETESGE